MALYKFVPKINKFDFYSHEIIGGRLIQLIGETKDTFVPNNISTLQINRIIKRAKLCELLSSIEFTIDSYGLINYYLDSKPGELVNFEYLKMLLIEYKDSDGIHFIQKSLDFFKNNETELEDLKSNKETFETAQIKLNALIDFENTLHKSALKIDKEIRKNPDGFCFDENENPIDPNFDGPLNRFYPNGNIKHEYNFKNGHAHGEGLDYRLDGKKLQLKLFEEGKEIRVLERYDKNGYQK